MSWKIDLWGFQNDWNTPLGRKPASKIASQQDFLLKLSNKITKISKIIVWTWNSCFLDRKWWTLLQLSINNCFQVLSTAYSAILKCALPTISALLSIELKNAICLDLWLSFSTLWTCPTALKVPEIVFSERFPSELTLWLFYELILRFQIGWIKILNFARCLPPPQLIPRTL